MEEREKPIIIEIDKEFLAVLKDLEKKIKTAAWDGLEKVSYKNLTRILAKKIRALKIV